MIGELFAIVAPVFCGAGIGFIWARLERPYDTEFVTTLTYNVGTPCLVFATLTRFEVSPATFGSMAGYAVLATLCFALVATLVLKLSGLALRPYLPSLMFPNAGNMGLPLCLFAFGEKGLALGIAFFTVTSLGNFTIGAAIAAGSTSWHVLVRTPLIYAIAAAALFVFSGSAPPAWLANTTRLIGGLMIPLLLITLGVSLARLKVADLRRGFWLSLLRLGMGIGVGIGLAELLDLEGVTRGVFIIDCAMPVAVFNYLFAQRYGNAPTHVAGMVVISSTLSFLTLPLLLLLVI
ncbi:MAG: AEC family transporter [Alphaproteobacteria bacterium]|jgi:hypothetical protein|nr:hypothetical protein [Rhodospirillaceae bacterium]MDP6407017.1 AEC family transporter [Alphaproteobacteria bacterium]MDP6621059.1 AEC family transporter [Alphaproteobacteria bacterium]|tara:strand:+ start:4632 stop:5507 length:876 start_codon:yes stop_codon:yes gene_type:complete